MLKKSSGGNQGSKATDYADVQSCTTLDAKIQSSYQWNSGLYRIDDLQISSSDSSGTFLCTFSLAELDQDSGKTKNPVNCTQFAIKGEGKEMSLFSGLLGRHCSIGQLRYHRLIHQDLLVEEIRRLRAENSGLQQEVENLYGALDSLQKPKRLLA